MEGEDNISVVPMTDGQGAEDIVLEQEEQEVERRLSVVNDGVSPEDTRFRFRFDVKVGAVVAQDKPERVENTEASTEAEIKMTRYALSYPARTHLNR